MEQLFPGYYPLPEDQKVDFICKSTIILGASVLLDLYRISHGSLFLKILKEDINSDNLWLPYDTAWLYHKRLSCILQEQIEEVKTASKYLNSFKEKIDNPFSHPFISTELVEKYTDFIGELQVSLDKDSTFLINSISDNKLKDKIAKLYNGKVGLEYTPSEMIQLYDESEKRNKSQIPPCFTFSSSPDIRIRHNRYIIWKQMQKMAKETKKPVVLVLNRITPNWFFISKDDVVLPNQELVNEFKQQTGQDIYIITAHDFIDTVAKKRNDELPKLLKQLHNKPTMGNNQQISSLKNSTI